MLTPINQIHSIIQKIPIKQNERKHKNNKKLDLTGATKGYSSRVKTSSDRRRRLNMENHNEPLWFWRIRIMGFELNVIKSPIQRVHALFTAVDGNDHTVQLSGHGFWFCKFEQIKNWVLLRIKKKSVNYSNYEEMKPTILIWSWNSSILLLVFSCKFQQAIVFISFVSAWQDVYKKISSNINIIKLFPKTKKSLNIFMYLSN